MKKEINQINFTSRRENNYIYTRNEVLNKINESSLKQQINHRKDWGKTRHSKEISNQSDINIDSEILFFFFFLSSKRG